MRKCSAADASSEGALQPRQLVLQILRLLAVCPWRGVRSNSLNRVADTADSVAKPGHYDGEGRRQDAVVVDKESIAKFLSGVTSNE